MRLQMLRLVGVIALALVVVYSAITSLYSLNTRGPMEYSISAAQLAESLQKGDRPLAQSFPASSMHFPEPLRQRLESGEIVGLNNNDDEILFYQLSGDNVLEIGPFPDQPAESVTHWRLFFIGTMLLVLIALTWPMFRDLHWLQKQAIQFSRKPYTVPQEVGRRSPIYPLAETFRRMANIVTGYFQMNQDLARTIAHEIRMPLARIKFQLALDHSSEESKSGSGDESRRVINRATRDIEQLVDKFLSFARMEIHEEFIVPKQVSLETFFGDLGSTLEEQCPALEIGYYFPDDMPWFEPDSMAIAVQNLVVNAGKYARDRVDIRFEVDGDFCSLSVEDNGPGLAGDAVELTDAFTRAATDEQGYGLGLYIVKKVVMWHEGELAMDRSANLGGTRATLTWPNRPRGS